MCKKELFPFLKYNTYIIDLRALALLLVSLPVAFCSLLDPPSILLSELTSINTSTLFGKLNTVPAKIMYALTHVWHLIKSHHNMKRTERRLALFLLRSLCLRLRCTFGFSFLITFLCINTRWNYRFCIF